MNTVFQCLQNKCLVLTRNKKRVSRRVRIEQRWDCASIEFRDNGFLLTGFTTILFIGSFHLEGGIGLMFEPGIVVQFHKPAHFLTSMFSVVNVL